MKTILITGSNGQLGQAIQQLAASSTHRFLFTDAPALDITDPEAVKAYFVAHRVTDCINCAAYTAVDAAESDAEAARMVNVVGAENLALAAASQKATLCHISTDFVFDGQMGKPYKEGAPTNPLGVYGATKLEGEQRAMAANPRTFVVRTAWLYAAHGKNFVKTMLRLGSERPSLNVVADQVGTPTYAPDLAKVLLQLLEAPPEVAHGVYHYSNEGVASWYDFAVAIFELAGMQVEVHPIPTEAYPVPARRPSYSVLDKQKIKGALHCPVPHWRESLRHCIALLQR